jgi:multimeric flavodoxin WrbA
MLKNKVGGAVAIGGSRNGGQELTIQNIHAWMHIHGIIVVGDNNHFGGIVKAPFDKDEEGVKTVKATAEKLCQVISLVKK